MTAHTTTQSSQTTHIVVDSKEPAFAGNFAVLDLAFPVSVRIRGLSGRFWLFVSATGNAVPGSPPHEARAHPSLA